MTKSFNLTFIRINKYRSTMISLILRIVRLSMINLKKKLKLCLRRTLKLKRLCRLTWRILFKKYTVKTVKLTFWEEKSLRKLTWFSKENNIKKIKAYQLILKIHFSMREIKNSNKLLNIIKREMSLLWITWINF